MDLIDRQEAIDAIEGITSNMSVCINKDECHGMKRMQRQAVLEIANMPSAQPERWIPCSERLPEVGQPVLLSVGGVYTTEGCLRVDGDWCQFRWNTIRRKDMVGAWMPLPEPWKGDDDAQDCT